MPAAASENTAPADADARYLRLAHAALAVIEAAVDRWLDEDVVDIDARRTGGLLELTLPDRSTIVVNLQPPLRELWMASKAAGQHFRLADDGRWLDTRSGAEFFAELSARLAQQAGRPLAVEPPAA